MCQENPDMSLVFRRTGGPIRRVQECVTLGIDEPRGEQDFL
jgi:hypothetical protein